MGLFQNLFRRRKTEDFNAIDHINDFYLTYLTDEIKTGITVEEFKSIVQNEKLDQIPDGDGYGGYREIKLFPPIIEGHAWTEVIATENNQFVITGTGERGTRGHSYYFEEESIALAHFVAVLRALKEG